MRTSSSCTVRVGINAYFSRAHLRHTGSGQYLTHLLARMPDAASGLELLLYEPSPLGGALSSMVPDAAGVRRVGPRLMRSLPPALSKLHFEQIGFPALASADCDVLHYPYWAAPLRCKIPTVVTVHDLIPLLLDSYRGTLLVRMYTALIAAATPRATMLIVDSEATKSDVVARFRLPSNVVRVIYLAADERFRPTDDQHHLSMVCHKYSLDRPFIFYVGGLDRRKNVDLLIAAFAAARQRFSSSHLLAVAGDVQRRGALFPDLPAVARKFGVSDVVRFLGVVPEGDLPALYQSATAVAFPSSYEGFGLPPLEALACAVPVLCSNAGSLREVVGDAAITIDPADTAAWAGALVRVINDESLRAELRRRAPVQAARFDWRRTALETAAVYSEAIARWKSAKGATVARSHAF